MTEDVPPEQSERRARLVSAIARGRRWLDDVVSGRVTTVAAASVLPSFSKILLLRDLIVTSLILKISVPGPPWLASRNFHSSR